MSSGDASSAFAVADTRTVRARQGPSEPVMQVRYRQGPSDTNQAEPVRAAPVWPRSVRALVNRVHRTGRHGPVQPCSIECRLGHFAAHEGFGPRALDLLNDMLFSDLQYEVREGLCSQAMLASHARLICARFDALRSAVNSAVAEGPDSVLVCTPSDQQPAYGAPAYGARGRNMGEARRGGPYALP